MVSFFKILVFDKKFWKFVNIPKLWVYSIEKKYQIRDQCLGKVSKKLLHLLRVQGEN